MQPPKKPGILDDFPTETVHYNAHPAMFRNAPVLFILAVLLVPVGLGAIALVVWWLQSRGTELIVTDSRTLLRKGIFSRSVSDIKNEDVRNITVHQTFFQRLMGVGSVGISSAGQGTVEIQVEGIPDPDRVRQIINQSR